LHAALPISLRNLTLDEVESVTTSRQGGVYRLETDRPVAVFFHAPAAVTASNEGALLLPEHVMTGNYIVASYPNSLEDYPSYFTAIGATDQTTVQFTVPQPTLAGGGIPALQANETGQTTLDRYELLNVVPAADLNGDLSGTIVTANHPIWLTGAVECV